MADDDGDVTVFRRGAARQFVEEFLGLDPDDDGDQGDDDEGDDDDGAIAELEAKLADLKKKKGGKGGGSSGGGRRRKRGFADRLLGDED